MTDVFVFVVVLLIELASIISTLAWQRRNAVAAHFMIRNVCTHATAFLIVSSYMHLLVIDNMPTAGLVDTPWGIIALVNMALFGSVIVAVAAAHHAAILLQSAKR